MANPFLEPSKKAGSGTVNQFLSKPSKKSGGPANPFLSTKEAEVPLEQQVADSGASTFLDTAKSAGGAVLDVLSRANYAVAGAAEEAFTPQGRGAGAILPRIGTELFSGIGGLKGQKEGFAEVMEQAGVGPGGSFSDVASFLYNDNPDSWFAKGGALDPTVRGFAGLAGDIFLDPTTYLGVGAVGKLSKVGKTAKAAEMLKPEVQRAARAAADKAIEAAEKQAAKFLPSADAAASAGAHKVAYDSALKVEAEKSVRAMAESNPDLVYRGGMTFLGHTIPGTPVLNTIKANVGEAASKVLNATPAGQSAVQAVGRFTEGTRRLFQHGRDVKDYKGVIEAEQKLNAGLGAQIARWNHALKELSDKYDLSDLEKAQVVRAVDTGDFSALKDARLQDAAAVVRDKGQQILDTDIATGLQLTPVQNYIHHAYHDAPEKVEAVLSRYPPKWIVQYGADLGFLEKRTFDTLDEAAKAGLHPIYDPWELLRRRGTESLKARAFRTYEQTVTQLTGATETWRIPDAWDMAMKGKRTIKPEETRRIAEILTEPPKGKQVSIGKLSDNAKQAYFEERFALAKSPQETMAIIGKYQGDFERFFPKGAADFKGVDPTGKAWTSVNIKGLGDRSLPADVAKHVAEMNKAFWSDQNFGKFLDAYDYLTNAFKLGVTAFPAFHVRNAYNNVAQSFLKTGAGIFDPNIQRDAVAMLMGHEGTFMGMPLSALRTAFEDAGIIIPGNTMLEYTGRNAGRGKLFDNRFAQAHRKVGTAIENEGRIAHALVELKAGKSLDETVASVNQALVDYNALTKTEREVLRRVFPFYTWQRKNLEFQYKMLKTNPGRQANLLKPFRGRNNENEQMTSFEAGAYKLRLDGDGKTVRMVSGVDLPIRNLDLLWRGNIAKTMLGVVGMTAPQLKAPIEVGFGKSAFTGKEFDRKQSDTIGRMAEHLPQSMQEWLGYKKENDAAGRPRYTFDGQRFYVLFQSWMFSRIVSTSDRQFREYLGSDHAAIGTIVDFMTGLRLKNLNLSDEQEKKLREREAAAHKALQRAGEEREFRRSYRPKGQP